MDSHGGTAKTSAATMNTAFAAHSTFAAGSTTRTVKCSVTRETKAFHTKGLRVNVPIALWVRSTVAATAQVCFWLGGRF